MTKRWLGIVSGLAMMGWAILKDYESPHGEKLLTR
jgi:hypothetical protein